MKKQLVTIFTLLALGGTQLTYALDKDTLQGVTAPETEETKAMMMEMAQAFLEGITIGGILIEIYRK